MAAATIPVTRHLWQLVAPANLAGLSDAQLLERFAGRRDEAAFAALVRRYGPLVLGVCRRVLGDWHGAEDAFQATFLVLARKAGSIRRPERLAGWLHGVARRTAGKARAAAARRRLHEREAGRPAGVEPDDEFMWRDLRPILDEAVAGLPEKYREPVILCYLEGRTNAEAARQLGCPPGTVAVRLARARQRLRGRLARRGLALPAVLATVLSGAAALPAGLAGATIRAGLWFAGNPAGAGGMVSAEVAALTQGVLRMMTRSKLVISLGVFLAAGLAVTVAGLGLRPAGAEPPARTEPREAPRPEPRQGARPRGDREKLQGTWQKVEVRIVERKGKELEQKTAPQDPNKLRLTFRRNQVIARVGQKTTSMGYHLDPTTNPKQFDLETPEGGTGRFIYKLEGDRLTICQGAKSGERPRSFGDPPEGERLALVIFERSPSRRPALRERIEHLEQELEDRGKELKRLRKELEALKQDVKRQKEE